MRSAAGSRAFIATTAVLLLTGLWSARPLSHDDIFWHMRTAEIVLEEGAVPTVDSFSFTRAGEPWVSHEWGFGVVLFAVYRVAGFPGLLALQVVLMVAIFASLALFLGRLRPRPPNAEVLLPAILAVGLWAAFHELKLNAAPVTTLFLVWELILLQTLRRTGKRVHIVTLALLFLVWSNVHCGVLFGLMLLGFWYLEARAPAFLPDFLGRLRAPTGRVSPVLRLALLLGATLISLTNPNGAESLLYPVRLTFFLFKSELPLDMGHFTAPTPGDRPGFFLLIALLLAGLVPLRQARRLTLFEILPLLMFLVLSVRSNRFILDFAVFASPVLLKLHGGLGRIRTARLIPVATAAVLLLATLGTWRSAEWHVLSPEIPRRAAAFLEENAIHGNLLNHQNYGGYLHWRLRRPVFWDGRNDVFGALMKDLVGLSFDEITERYDVDVLLLTERQVRPLRDRGELSPETWGLVYWDDWCAVFVRRSPDYRKILEKYEYRVFPAFPSPEDIERLRSDPLRLQEARAELDRVLEQNPGSHRARYYRGFVSLQQGDLWAAKSDLEEAARIRPDRVIDRALLEVTARLLPKG